MGNKSKYKNKNQPKKMKDHFGNAVILDKNGDKVDAASLSSKDFVLIYFSAHWCPPCRGFTPVLAEFYNEAKAAGKNIEIVFVSSDQDEGQWKTYWESQPWLAMKYKDEQTQTLK